jgi:S-adenosylmethionine hydrolase
MKGAVLAINPRAVIVDITHDIEPHSVMAGALVLGAAYATFPAGSIHVAVIDPGVGSQRRALILETSAGYFLGPDNGIFSVINQQESVSNRVSIENPRFMAPKVSRTFHGRDVFAPAAAYVSLGVPLERFGPAVGANSLLAIPSPRVTGDAAEGEVIHADRFGNLITNIPEDLFHRFVGEGDHEIRIGEQRVSGPYESYEDGRDGEIFSVFGSSGALEISMKKTSAQKRLGLDRGAVVTVFRSPRSGGKQ